MVKLKRLKINKYRNVRPGTELHFDDGVNLVLGQNGAGKTTLLGLISTVVSNDFTRLKGETFSVEYVLVADSKHVVVSVESSGYSRDDDSSVHATEAFLNEVDYRYSVEAEDAESNRSLSVQGAPQGVTVISPEQRDRSLPASTPFSVGFLLNAVADASDGLLSRFWNVLLRMHVGPVARFDEALDCFFAMTGRAPILSSAGVPSTARLNVRYGPKLKPAVRFIQFTPWHLANVVPEAHQNPGGAIRIELPSSDDEPSPPFHEELQFLVNAARTFGARAVALKPEIKTIQESRHDTETFEVEGFSFDFTRSDGATIHHDRLSYGQKRLLAYFYYLACTLDYVIADELVNGLHHRWIEACMDAIGERQAFLTSQNPLLFEYVKFDSVEQVEARFITCKTEMVDGSEQLVWQNMPREDAIRFFRGYQADIEGVGDILINRGLW